MDRERALIYRAYERAAGDERLSSRDVLVLLALCKYANRDGSHCYPSNETLARDLKLSRSSVERAVARLSELEYIERTRRRRKSAVTRILDPSTVTVQGDQEPSPVTVQADLEPSNRALEPSNRALEPAPVTDNRPKTVPVIDRGARPPDALVEIPTRGDPPSWWLTEKIRTRIQAEFPTVDVVAVAEDMARKIRSGAREPYSARGMPKALASWVAQEAKSPRKPVAELPDTCGVGTPGGDGEWCANTVRRSDRDEHGGGDGSEKHPRWDEYEDFACGVAPRTAPPFTEWLGLRDAKSA